jgi:hypothetical protein
MALIRFGSGSELYIYPTDKGYVCCGCIRNQASLSFDTKDELKAHILVHKEANDTIGLVGNSLTYQSYKELIDELDGDGY